MSLTSRPTSPKRAHRPSAKPEVCVVNVPLSAIRPSPENDQLYHPIAFDNPNFLALVESVAERGVLEPVIVTADGWIISGHRRHAAATAAGLRSIPIRRLSICRDDDCDEFVRLLREHNRQRVKTYDESIREEIILIDSDDAYAH